MFQIQFSAKLQSNDVREFTKTDGTKSMVADMVFYNKVTTASGQEFIDRIQCSVFGENVAKIIGIQQDDFCEVKAYANASEYNGKWYNRIVIREIEVKEMANGKVTESPQPFSKSNDDMPF